MRILFLLFFMIVQVNAQLLNETFSNFFPDTTNWAVKGMYPFGATGQAVTADVTAKGNTLTANNFSADFVDELVTGNPIISGQNVLKFNGSNEFFNIADASADDFDIADGEDFTYVYFINMGETAFSGVVSALDNNYYFRTSNLNNNGAGGIVVSFDGSDNYYRYKNSAVFTANSWHQIVLRWDDSDSVAIYIDGNWLSGTSTTGTFTNQNNMGVGNFFIGKYVNGQFFSEKIAFVAFCKSLLSPVQISETGYLANGWKSNSGGVTRVNLSTFSQGVITDTVYYNTALTAETWDVSVDVDGNSGGETYQILTSADKSTWTALKSASAPASSTTITATGAGLGYIGLAVSSAADTVFFDNLNVSTATTTAKFSGKDDYPEYADFYSYY